jgi:hypothetical protein
MEDREIEEGNGPGRSCVLNFYDASQIFE